LALSTQAQTLPNGVAAGDVDQTSAILWTRSDTVGTVTLTIARDRDFDDVLEGHVINVLDPLIPVKIETTNLVPNTEYHYRATALEGASRIGRFRTPAADGHRGLRFGVSGDWRGELRPYPAIANIPDRDLDLFIALGDTIYADFSSPAVMGDQARTLDQFRRKHDEVYGEQFGLNTWADARASMAWLACIDDHEVTNDFAGGASPASDARFDQTGAFINETQLYQNGLQAFHEYNPIREEFYGDTGDPRTAGKRRLYRYRTYGQDAAFFVLDARSFRDEELPPVRSIFNRGAIRRFVRDSFDASRTMLGAMQLADLKRDLLDADNRGITWKFVLVPEPIQNLGPVLASDRFEGYEYERTQLLGFIDEQAIPNVVFIAADIHGTIVNNLVYRRSPRGRKIETDSFEITTGAVAFDSPLGPTAIAFTPPFLMNFYEDLLGPARDVFIRRVGNFLLPFLGYPRIGLYGSPIESRLLQGGWVAVNHFGWTEFEIDADTQDLLVTTYGIAPYAESDLSENPEAVIACEPDIVSQFWVRAMRDDEPAAPEGTFVCSPRGSPCGAIGGIFLFAYSMLFVASLRNGRTSATH